MIAGRGQEYCGSQRRGARRRGRWALGVVGVVVWVLTGLSAVAQSLPASVRTGRLQWNAQQTQLQVSVSFRDVATPEVLRKLRLGLPLTIVLTGVLKTPSQVVGSTFQRCKVTWHVWEEMYRIEESRASETGVRRSFSPTVHGVLRRCAEADRLVVGQRGQVPMTVALVLDARVLVNPVSPQLLDKIKRWISRPASTASASSASKLFSTFTGLFMTRVGEAEGELRFSTRPTFAPALRQSERPKASSPPRPSASSPP